jgi:hypothetical protein
MATPASIDAPDMGDTVVLDAIERRKPDEDVELPEPFVEDTPAQDSPVEDTGDEADAPSTPETPKTPAAGRPTPRVRRRTATVRPTTRRVAGARTRSS